MAKVAISIDDDLLAAADNFADEHYTSRSGLISTALINYLDGQKVIDSIQRMSFALASIATNGNISDKDRDEIKNFKALAELMCKRF